MTTIQKKQWWRSLPVARFAIVVAWVVACVVGMAELWRYQSTPAAPSEAPLGWPVESHISRDPSRTTLVMFAHPHCPCTRASLAELERIVSQSGGTVRPRIVFFKPSDSPDDWHQTDEWETATSIPGAQVIVDIDGEEARKFRATTSGHTLLYGLDGGLLFSGGITPSRGHQGDNDGRSSVVRLVSGRTSDRRNYPVFGCPIIASAKEEITGR